MSKSRQPSAAAVTRRLEKVLNEDDYGLLHYAVERALGLYNLAMPDLVAAVLHSADVPGMKLPNPWGPNSGKSKKSAINVIDLAAERDRRAAELNGGTTNE